jgi:hypothetical protein
MANTTPQRHLNRRLGNRFLKTVILGLTLLFLSAQAAYSQNCPSASTTNFTFEPASLGASMTVTIDLAPCETMELHESHDMLGDGNRGTEVDVTYLNSSDVPLYTQGIFGFYSATDNIVPSSYSEPFPWVGIRSALVQPAKIKLQSSLGYGQGYPPIVPQYRFTIVRSPRPGYNIGGDSFGNAPLAPSFPTTYRGSVRDGTAVPADPGQYFKIHLNGNQQIYATGTVTQNTYYGTNFVLDIFNSNQQQLTNHWLSFAVYGVNNYTTGTFTNPNPNPADFYIRAWSNYGPTRDFSMTINSVVQSCACPDIPIVP